MSTTTESGISTDRLKEISDLVKRAGEEAVQLRVVERFLSEVERRLLKQVPMIFDIQRVRTALQILKSLSEEDEIDECLEAEFRLDQEFHLWRELIVERDQKIETYHFRRLCDSAPYPLEDEIFIALASFYRGLDLTPSTQSKFDLSVTRLFSRTVDGGRREMKGLRSDNVRRLKGLFTQQDAIVYPTPELRSAISTIESFTNEALNLGTFEELVKAKIFDRFREFKRDLGPLFFEPEIVAAAIECNVAVGNVFNDLLKSADEHLSSRLTVDVDLAGALHDPAPETRSHINELFRVFFGEHESNDEPLNGDVDYLGKLLSASTVHHKSSETKGRAQVDSTSAQGRLAPVLRSLTEARPDADSLSKQMQRSECLRTLDVNDFLYAADGRPDILCRRAFGLVLWSLEFRENDLKHNKELTESMQREATSLLYKAEALASKLQHEIEISDEHNESRLRAVLNALLDSRLKLERGIVRFTNRKFVESPQTPQVAAVRPSNTHKETRLFGSAFSRWAIIVLILVGATAGVYSFVQQQFGSFTGNGPNLSNIDIRTLPDHEFMKASYRYDQTLFITARDTWMQRTSAERADTISKIFGKDGFKFRTVVIMSESGSMLENVSRDNLAAANSGTAQ